jgi:hypothetical protein
LSVWPDRTEIGKRTGWFLHVVANADSSLRARLGRLDGGAVHAHQPVDGEAVAHVLRSAARDQHGRNLQVIEPKPWYRAGRMTTTVSALTSLLHWPQGTIAMPGDHMSAVVGPAMARRTSASSALRDPKPRSR